MENRDTRHGPWIERGGFGRPLDERVYPLSHKVTPPGGGHSENTHTHKLLEPSLENMGSKN